MQFNKFLPCKPLRKYIKSYWTIKGDLGKSKICWRDIPDGNLEIIINYGSPFKKIDKNGQVEVYRAGGIKGQFDHAVFLEQSGRIEIIGISVEPFGLSAFLGNSIHEMTNLAVSLDLLFDEDDREMLYQEYVSGNWINFLNQAFLSRIRSSSEINPVLISVINDMKISNQISIRQLSQENAISIKGLQRLFRERIGLSPKKFYRIIRMKKLIDKIPLKTKIDWMQLVVEFDLYDRAHLSNEFKTINGTCPTEFSLNRNDFASLFIP